MRTLSVCLGLFALPEALNRLPLVWTCFLAGTLLGVGLALVPSLMAARRWRAEADESHRRLWDLLESPDLYAAERRCIEEVAGSPEIGLYGRKSGQPGRRIIL
jgi:hypothetical protein